jgi:hypothetical protein
MAISPRFGLEYQRHQVEQQSVQVDTQLKKMQAVSQIARSILEADLSGGGQAAGQAAYDRARPLLRQIAPELEAQIPSVYTRNGVQQFYDAGLGPLQQLQQSQAALNQQKARLTTTQVPDYGATPTVNAEIYALHGEKLRREGRGPTPEEVQQAQDRIAARELKQKEREGFQTTQARLEGEQTFQDRQPASLVLKDQMGHYFDRATGNPEKPGQSYKAFRERSEADKTAYLPTEQAKQLFALKQVEPLLGTVKEAVEYAYGDKGPLKEYSRMDVLAIPRHIISQALQSDPKLQAYRRTLEGQIQTLVRAFGGRGDFNAQEMEAATALIPQLGAALGLSVQLGPQYGRGGFGFGAGVKPELKLPDTPGVAQETTNQLLAQHRARVGELLGNRDYKGVQDVALPRSGGMDPYRAPSVPPEAVRVPEAPQAPAPAATTQPPPGLPVQTPQPGELGAGRNPYAPQIAPTPHPAPATPAMPTPRLEPLPVPEAPAPAPVQRQSVIPQRGYMLTEQDIQDAMRQTGRKRRDVIIAARRRGYDINHASFIA